MRKIPIVMVKNSAAILMIAFQMNALKNLGLNVVKGNVYLDSSGKHNKFAITKA